MLEIKNKLTMPMLSPETTWMWIRMIVPNRFSELKKLYSNHFIKLFRCPDKGGREKGLMTPPNARLLSYSICFSKQR